MTDPHTSLASLIGSRICHDLISPIGAINNGLELLTLSGDQTGPEIGLIGESVGNASARIRFFRIAFGAAGDQMVGPAEVHSILRDLYDNSRLSPVWNVSDARARSEVRLAFLAILCMESAMPYGGRVDIAVSAGSWRLTGTADRISVDPDLWSMLSRPCASRSVQPSQVQFILLPLIAADANRRIICQSDQTSVTISF